ncbi:MAG: cellulase family glycosylhydrolase, partial [Anaerolineae bacterium]|nr:cellulase family glycosylhydrolase [Anaerolineae bacterium]
LGLKWVKVQLPWRDMQPNGPDERDNEFFRRIEQHLEDANNRGMNMLVSVVKAPTWARSVQAEDGPPDDPNALARFITIIFEEFNAGLNREMVGEYIDAIEIWNEPNLQREWQGTLPFNGAGYMQLFGPAYQAVRAYSPTITVVTAGLAPTSTQSFSVDDRDFLRQMYNAGLAQYGDVVVGVHPYGWGNAP